MCFGVIVKVGPITMATLTMELCCLNYGCKVAQYLIKGLVHETNLFTPILCLQRMHHHHASAACTGCWWTPTQSDNMESTERETLATSSTGTYIWSFDYRNPRPQSPNHFFHNSMITMEWMFSRNRSDFTPHFTVCTAFLFHFPGLLLTLGPNAKYDWIHPPPMAAIVLSSAAYHSRRH